MKTIYVVMDNANFIVRNFTSYKDAKEYVIANAISYRIRVIKYTQCSTWKQRKAIKFIEDILNITFNGDINDVDSVSLFIYKYLNQANNIYNKQIKFPF